MLNVYSVDEIVITQAAGYDEWNEPLPDREITIRGYAEWKTKLIRNIKGEQVASMITIYISKRRLDNLLARSLSHEDRIKSINGNDIDRAIINISQPKAFSNPDYEIYL